MKLKETRILDATGARYACIAEAIKAVSKTDDDVPAIAFALSRRTISHFEQV